MKKILYVLLIAVFAFGLYGCGDDGDDGAMGPAGPEGPAGPQGEPGLDGADGEDGEDFTASVAHPAELEKPVVSNIVVSRDTNDLLTVSFDVFEADGTTPLSGIGSIAPSDAGDIRVYMSSIVPAGTETANTPKSTWLTAFPEGWAEQRGTTEGTELTENNGRYSFTMTPDALTGIGGSNAPEATLDQYQRVYIRADARDFEGFTRTMGVADFIMPEQGADTGVIDGTTRTIVADSACTSCHNDPLEEAAHGGGYQSPQVCLMCHTPIGERGDGMQESGAWLANLIHKIHAAIKMEAYPDRVTDEGYAGVTYPKVIEDCSACHFDDGQDMADAWKTNPTIETCTSCHVDTTFVGEDATHTAGAQPNISCTFCHKASDIEEYHGQKLLKHADVPTSITPEYDASIALSPAPNADGYYEAGDVITVTVTSDIEGTDYANDYDGTRLYVYGPRSGALPVLTPGSTTDPSYDPETDTPEQGGGDLVANADGFTFTLQAIPEDLEPGTYMVQAALDHATLGRTPNPTSSHAYNIDGWAFTTFQVGTATETPSVTGDGCASCHELTDWSSMYHRSYFGADGCVACHDNSGNYAAPLGNRVHAIHSASEFGAENGTDWSDVTYPQDTTSCTACHSSGSTSYKTEMYTSACIGCHAEESGGVEIHMETNSVDKFNGGCIACHGEGKSAAIFE